MVLHIIRENKPIIQLEKNNLSGFDFLKKCSNDYENHWSQSLQLTA